MTTLRNILAADLAGYLIGTAIGHALHKNRTRP